MSSAGSSSMSVPKGLAKGESKGESVPRGHAKASCLAIWVVRVVEFARGLLKLGTGTDESQAALTAMPKDNNVVTFQTVVAFMGVHGSSGSREYARNDLVRDVHLFRWKHLDIAREILLQPDLLQEYAFDGAPRDLFGIGDSTPYFQ